MSPTSTFPQWLDLAMEALHAGDVDGYMQMYAPDAVHEFPFAPEETVSQLVGRDAIAAFMNQPRRTRILSYSNVRVREVGDEFIIEATSHRQRLSDNTLRDLTYIWFITRRDGQVTHFRDYMNPLQLSPRPPAAGRELPGST